MWKKKKDLSETFGSWEIEKNKYIDEKIQENFHCKAKTHWYSLVYMLSNPSDYHRENTIVMFVWNIISNLLINIEYSSFSYFTDNHFISQCRHGLHQFNFCIKWVNIFVILYFVFIVLHYVCIPLIIGSLFGRVVAFKQNCTVRDFY